ncbi:MAG: metal-independent alpha-mannosidase, partial [Eubacteriales bacterium]|nr:metal-independent alpha-mannosidase [Eubacteriales bacterium]MDD3214560.1 metal-independent alpha-mannosidase [Eubacteriales bacterium]
PIAEIGCRHAPHPWVLSICNSLLSGHAREGFAHLKRTQMDNGVACESVNEQTGVCETGEAFATCAGFLAYAIEQSLSQANK